MKITKNRENYIIYGIILLILLFIGSRYYDYQSRKKQVSSSTLETPTELVIQTVDKSSTSEPSVIYIHVSGKVVSPGLVTLKSGMRVIDAIEAAGGALPEGNLDAVNLAKVLQDEDKIYIPSIEEVASVESKGLESTTGQIDINQADESQLIQVPGIGPKTAQKIIKYRESNTFRSIEDLKKIEGIGDKKFEQLKDFIICQ